jgi:hypothetical protein
VVQTTDLDWRPNFPMPKCMEDYKVETIPLHADHWFGRWTMIQRYGCILATCCLLGPILLGTSSSAALPTPDLSSTTLYTKTVHGCQAVDLTTWQHPVRRVLQAAQAQIVKVELCNGLKFPVFTVVLPYDVDGQADRYFHRLYAGLAEANGFWPYALVDLANNLVTTVDIERSNRTVSPAYEDFRGPVGAAR